MEFYKLLARLFIGFICAGCIFMVACSKRIDGQTKDNKVDTIIIGGGIAGLSAASFLQEEDYDVIVLEKNSYAGGRTESGRHEGFRYAKGTEYLGKPDSALKKLIAIADIKLREIPYPTDAHWRDGQFYYADDGLAHFYIQNGGLEKYNRFMQTVQKMYKGYAEAPDFKPGSKYAHLDQMTAREWFQKEGFDGVYLENYNVAARGLFGANLDEISALSLIPEIAFDYEDARPVKKASDVENKLPKKGSYSSGTYSFTGGIADLTEALADHLDDAMQYEAEVRKISKTGEIWHVEYTQNGETKTIHSESVILATPAPISLQIAGDHIPPKQKKLLEQIHYAPYITLSLFTKKAIWNKTFDLSIQDGYFFTDIYDSTWTQRHYDDKVQNRSDSIMTLYIGPHSYKDQRLLQMSDQEILQKSYQELKKIFGKDIEKQITGHDIRRFAHAYPVMSLGAYGRLSELNRLNKQNDNGLFLAGDYLIYPTFEAAVESGENAADLVDEWMED